MSTFDDIIQSLYFKVRYNDPYATMLQKIQAKKRYCSALHDLSYVTVDIDEREELLQKYRNEQDNIEIIKRDIKSKIRYSILDVITDVVYEKVLDDYK